MIEATQVRRSVHGLGGVVIAILAMTSGCEHLPVPRANTAPIHIPPPVPFNSAAQKGDVPELKEIDEHEVLPPLPAQMTEANESVLKVAKTPILDETLARLEAHETEERLVALNEAAEPDEDDDGASESSPKDAPPEPRTAAVEALKGNSASAERPAGAIDPGRPAKVVDPKDLWREGIARLQGLAGEQAASSSADASPWSLRARLLEVVARADSAEDPTRNPLWRVAFSALNVAGSRTPDDRARAAEIRAAVDALEEEAPLEITELQLCKKVTGFGEFEPINAATCRPGNPLIIYCEMSGLRYAAAGDRFRSRLTSHVELVPARGGNPVWDKALGTAEDTCRRRRRDYYVNFRIVLADNLPPGNYELRLKQTDENAGRSATSSIPLTIQP